MATVVAHDQNIPATVAEIIGRYPGRDQDLIAVLQDIQEHYKYLPKEALKKVRDEMKIPLGRIYSVATFYNAFSLIPKGAYPVCVCTGTACHVKGAPRILETLEREVGVKLGQTSEDLMFSIEEVRCLGCCGLAPVITIGGDLYGQVKVQRIKGLVKRYRDKGSRQENA